jgi:hypothetical protein
MPGICKVPALARHRKASLVHQQPAMGQLFYTSKFPSGCDPEVGVLGRGISPTLLLPEM